MSVGHELKSVAEFEARIAENAAVLVDFVGPDCIVCRNIAPMLNVIGKEFSATLDLVSLDAAALGELAERFSIRSLPTLVLFLRGQEAVRRSGFATASELRSWINQALPGRAVS